MPMSVYVGPPRSGKTFEAVANVIVPALRDGRRVVSNISGLNEDQLALYTGRDDLELVQVTDDQLRDIAIYPTREGPGTIIRGGDLLVVDEAHNVFPAVGSKSLDPGFLMFFRTHGQMVDERGIALDIVFISQAINDIHVGIRRACEFVFNIRNLRMFGASKRYKVLTYMGWRMSEKEFLKSEFKKYDPAIYKLYQSFAGGVDGVLAVVDSKQRVFTKGKLLFMLAMLVLFALLLGLGVKNFTTLFSGQKCDGTGAVLDVERHRYFLKGQWHEVDKVDQQGNANRYWIGDCYLSDGGTGSV